MRLRIKLHNRIKSMFFFDVVCVLLFPSHEQVSDPFFKLWLLCVYMQWLCVLLQHDALSYYALLVRPLDTSTHTHTHAHTQRRIHTYILTYKQNFIAHAQTTQNKKQWGAFSAKARGNSDK